MNLFVKFVFPLILAFGHLVNAADGNVEGKLFIFYPPEIVSTSIDISTGLPTLYGNYHKKIVEIAPRKVANGGQILVKFEKSGSNFFVRQAFATKSLEEAEALVNIIKNSPIPLDIVLKQGTKSISGPDGVFEIPLENYFIMPHESVKRRSLTSSPIFPKDRSREELLELTKRRFQPVILTDNPLQDIENGIAVSLPGHKFTVATVHFDRNKKGVLNLEALVEDEATTRNRAEIRLVFPNHYAAMLHQRLFSKLKRGETRIIVKLNPSQAMSLGTHYSIFNNKELQTSEFEISYENPEIAKLAEALERFNSTKHLLVTTGNKIKIVSCGRALEVVSPN